MNVDSALSIPAFSPDEIEFRVILRTEESVEREAEMRPCNLLCSKAFFYIKILIKKFLWKFDKFSIAAVRFQSWLRRQCCWGGSSFSPAIYRHRYRLCGKPALAKNICSRASQNQKLKGFFFCCFVEENSIRENLFNICWSPTREIN